MKAIRSTGLLLAAALLSVKVMAQKPEEINVSLSDPGKPYKLTADLLFGTIKVIGYEGKDIIVIAQTDSKKRSDDDNDRAATGMRRLSGNGGLNVTVREKNNSVTIGSDMPMKSVNLDVKIPQNITNLKLSSVNGRSITVTNVNGNIEINGTNGSILLNDVSGSVVATTINGNIKGTLKNVDARSPLAFTTLNGNVDITFPANLRANPKLKTDHGNVYTDFDVVTNEQKKVETTHKDGMYRISIDDTIYGKIDGGGPELLMKTMNGNIYLRKAK